MCFVCDSVCHSMCHSVCVCVCVCDKIGDSGIFLKASVDQAAIDVTVDRHVTVVSDV